MSFEVLSPIWSHVNENEKKKKNWQNPKIWNFAILYTTLVEILPRSMQEFLELICYVNSEEMSFEVFSSIWPHVNENQPMFQNSGFFNFNDFN